MAIVVKRQRCGTKRKNRYHDNRKAIVINQVWNCYPIDSISVIPRANNFKIILVVAWG